jgi:O-methyltransferase involved in polyketide biosynthesis
LHAYGGETGESLRNMGYFFASQLAIILLGVVVYFVTSAQKQTKTI